MTSDVITVTWKMSNYSAVYVKIVIMNISQNFGQEKIIKYGIYNKNVKESPRIGRYEPRTI